MTSSVVVRSASTSDIPEILKLQQQAETAAQWSSSEYERIVAKGGVLLVAESEGNVCGFIAGSAVESEWELENVVVDQLMKRRGVGRLLIRRFLETAKGAAAKKAFLQVREDNASARALYEDAGFRVCGKRPRYYAQRDALVYVFDFD